MRAQRERKQQQQNQRNSQDVGDGDQSAKIESAQISSATDAHVSHAQEEEYERRKMVQQAQMDAQPAFRLHASRAEMMDNWSEDAGMTPSATVVRSSRAPAIRSKHGAKTQTQAQRQTQSNSSKVASTKMDIVGDIQETKQDADAVIKERPPVSFAGHERGPPAPPSAPTAPAANNLPKPVIKAAAIQERPVHLRSMAGSIQQQQQGGTQLQTGAGGKRPSKFLQRRMQQQGKAGGAGGGTGTGAGVGTGTSSFFVGGTAGGFPSLDVPIGTFARKGGNKQTTTRQPAVVKDAVALGSRSREESRQREGAGSGGGADGSNNADSMLSGMSRAEIMDGIAEIESALSEQSIAFLKARGRKKKQTAQATSGQQKRQEPARDIISSSALSTKPKENAAPVLDKAKEAEILSSIKTEEELDRVYSDFNASGGAPVLESSAPDIEAPGGKIQNLESATALLRSTSYRQTMLAAKTTCELLSKRMSAIRPGDAAQYGAPKNDRGSAGDYPALLPVALRCLLDLPQAHRHEQLHSYVLQSLRYLVELFAHPSHRVSTSLDDIERNASSVYQLNFLDENIPAPPAASCYESGSSKLSAAQKVEDSPVEGALYATNSSAESAKKDGEAFYADPLWTLLSRMRIIPCLARIIASAKGLGSESLPEEIVTSICSILSMLSLRSPGAACAIAQHQTILPQLVDMTLTPGAHFGQAGESKESFLVNPRAALPTLSLMCTLARQSRTVASQTEPFASIITTLHAILGISAETAEEHAVQKHCLLLWRILLRYGLAIPHLSTFISLATPHLSTKNETEFSLTADYLSAFSNVCECAKVITRAKTESSIRLTEEQADTLAMAGAWLSPHVQQCVIFLKQIASADNANANSARLTAARLRFLLSYVAASAPSDIMKLAVIEEETMGTKMNDVDKSAFVSVVSRRDCISALQAIFKSGLVDAILNKVLVWAFVSEWKGPLQVPTSRSASSSFPEEANSCAFLSAFVSMLSNMINNESIFDDGNGSMEERAEVKSIADEFSSLVYSTLSALSATDLGATPIPTAAQSGWIDVTLYVLVKFLCSMKRQYSNALSANDEAETEADDGLRLLRAMSFALIGRLKVGDEAIAAVLLSQDVLFVTPSFNDRNNQGSPLQAMLLRELVNSPRSQSQLDHSFKLHRGHGITTAGLGAFGLESLRSDAEFVAPPTRADEDGQGRNIVVEPLIPLGKVWLWQVLSSTIEPPPETSAQQRAELLHDATAVIVSSLELLTYLERGASSRVYTSQIHSGAKLYHLSNSCLFPEEVLRHEKFEQLFCSLFEDISSRDGFLSIPKAYVAACYQHSRTTRTKADNGSGKTNGNIDEEKLLELFEGKSSRSQEYSAKEVAALVDFVGDMCSAYIEYGAQYESLNHCIRLLLRYGFPPKARIEIITKLRGLLHLLTFQRELDGGSSEGMAGSLELSLAVGSQKEPPEVLDALVNALSSKDPNDSIRRLDAQTGGYAYYFAVASLAHSYASSILSKEPGAQEAAGRRMDRLDDKTRAAVLGAADAIEEKGLVSAVLKS